MIPSVDAYAQAATASVSTTEFVFPDDQTPPAINGVDLSVQANQVRAAINQYGVNITFVRVVSSESGEFFRSRGDVIAEQTVKALVKGHRVKLQDGNALQSGMYQICYSPLDYSGELSVGDDVILDGASARITDVRHVQGLGQNLAVILIVSRLG